MKRLFFAVAAFMMAVGAMASDKMTFVIGGPEEVYNQIRVENETSLDTLTCRVVILKGEDEIESVYGVYNLYGIKDSDYNTERIHRGTKLGIQMPDDFEGELSFDVEYKDRPFFDYIVIHLRDKVSRFGDKL